MDEALLRRLLGGGVLLVLAWLVAALLPPPKPVTERDEDTVVIDLRPVEAAPPAEGPQAVDDAMPADPADTAEASDAPAAPRSETAPQASVPTPAVAPRQPQETPPPSRAPTPAVRPSATPAPRPSPTAAQAPPPAGQFWVQVGAYGTRESAEQVRESLGVAGLSARVISAEVNGKQLHRVRIGPFKGRGDAESAQARAVLLGYSNAQVVGT